jgi:hypothetical protein
MIEVAAIPILMKAVDFLFVEGSKILQERRERRKAELETKSDATTAQSTGEKEDVETTQPTESTVAETTSGTEVPSVIQSKEAALSIPVDEAVWKDSEAEVKHLLSLLEVYTKNYYLAKEQYAKFGSALVPSIIVHNLAEAEDGVEATTEKLQTALGKVYGKNVVVPESGRA